VPFAQIKTGLAALGKNHNAAFCLIDTAPTISDQTASLVTYADLVVIPVRPSPSDLWAVAETVELVQAAGRPFLFSTGFVESAINQVVSRRFVKKQQMQWSLRGAHLLLQTRTKVLNDELEGTFRQWYPRFRCQAA